MVTMAIRGRVGQRRFLSPLLLSAEVYVHAKQLAVIHIRERHEVRHGRASVWFVAPAVAIRPTSRLIETTTAVMAILLRRGSS